MTSTAASGGRDRRRFPRYDVQLPVIVRRKAGDLPLMTVDVSRHGAFIRTDQPQPVRQLVQIRFSLPGNGVEAGPEIDAMCMIARWIPAGEPAGPGFGVDFFALSKDAKKYWEAFINDLKVRDNAAGFDSTTGTGTRAALRAAGSVPTTAPPQPPPSPPRQLPMTHGVALPPTGAVPLPPPAASAVAVGPSGMPDWMSPNAITAEPRGRASATLAGPLAPPTQQAWPATQPPPTQPPVTQPPASWPPTAPPAWPPAQASWPPTSTAQLPNLAAQLPAVTGQLAPVTTAPPAQPTWPPSQAASPRAHPASTAASQVATMAAQAAVAAMPPVITGGGGQTTTTVVIDGQARSVAGTGGFAEGPATRTPRLTGESARPPPPPSELEDDTDAAIPIVTAEDEASVVMLRLPDREAIRAFIGNELERGGMFLRTPLVKEVGDRVVVILVHPETDEEFHLEGTVVRRVITGPPEQRGLGIFFRGLSEEGQANLADFVEKGIQVIELGVPITERQIELEQAVAREPDSAEALEALGSFLLDEEGDLGGALAALTRALVLSPSQLAIHASLARAYRKIGDPVRVRAHERVAEALMLLQERKRVSLGVGDE